MPTRQARDKSPKVRPSVNMQFAVAKEHIAYLSSDTPCVRIVQSADSTWCCVPASTNRGFIVFLKGVKEGTFTIRLTEVRGSVAFAEVE